MDNQVAGEPKKSGCLGMSKWLLGCGCLFGLLICGGFLAFIFGIFGTVSVALKSSDAYKIAVARAKENADVREELGEPITEGFMPTGKVNVENNSGEADLTIAISV